MSNPEKPDGGETQKACAKPHVSFENEYLQCVLGEGHKGLHAAKSAFGGTLQWHDNLAPSPQPSAEATEPEAIIMNKTIRDLLTEPKCTCGDVYAGFVARDEEPKPNQLDSTCPKHGNRPAPSGETRGTQAEFEEWVSGKSWMSVEPNPFPEEYPEVIYDDRNTEFAWEVWQAARKGSK